MAAFNIDPTISLGAKPPTPISIGDMLNIARGAQEYQQAAQVNPLKARQAAAEASRAEAESNVAEQTQEPRISTAKSTAGKAETEAKSALVNLSKDQLANMWAHTTGVVQQIQLMKDDPNLSVDAITERAKQLNENVGGDDKSLEQSLMGLPKGKDGKPPSKTELKSWLAQKEASMLSAQAHIEKIYQPPTMQSVGNKIVPVAQGNQLLTGQTPGMQVGQANTIGLTPGTRAVAQPGDGTGLEPGTEYIIGTTGGSANAPAPTQSGSAQPFVPAKPIATSSSPAFTSQQEMAKNDFADVNLRASKAQTNIGILQEIKRLAPIAATGAAADRREMAIKWGQVLGLNIDPSTVTTAMASDLLKKESNMLAAGGGNTDASRLLSEMANPNSKMTKEAIEKASNQIIAQNKLVLLEQGVKQHFLSNPQDYIKAKSQLDSIKDPRALEYIEMQPDERKNVIASLNTGPNGKALPKGDDGLSDPARNFLRKVDGLKKLNNKYNLGLF